MRGELTRRQLEILRELAMRDGQTVGELASGIPHWKGTWRCVRLMRDRGLVALAHPVDDAPTMAVRLTERGRSAL